MLIQQGESRGDAESEEHAREHHRNHGAYGKLGPGPNEENAASTRMRELEDKCTEKAVIRRCETEDQEDSVEHP